MTAITRAVQYVAEYRIIEFEEEITFPKSLLGATKTCQLTFEEKRALVNRNIFHSFIY